MQFDQAFPLVATSCNFSRHIQCLKRETFATPLTCSLADLWAITGEHMCLLCLPGPSSYVPAWRFFRDLSGRRSRKKHVFVPCLCYTSSCRDTEQVSL